GVPPIPLRWRKAGPRRQAFADSERSRPGPTAPDNDRALPAAMALLRRLDLGPELVAQAPLRDRQVLQLLELRLNVLRRKYRGEFQDLGFDVLHRVEVRVARADQVREVGGIAPDEHEVDELQREVGPRSSLLDHHVVD